MGIVCYASAMASVIRFYKPALYRKDMDAVLQTMVDERIGPGERKKDFLKAMAAFLGKKDGIALRSYLDAIVGSLTALGAGDGDSVLISVLSPMVYLEAFRRLGVNAVLVDTDQYGLMSVDDALRKLDGSVKAVLYFEPVCQVPVAFDDVRNLGLPVIEDVSQSLGSYYGDKEDRQGEFYAAGEGGDITISSLEEEGVISTGGGAVAVTSNIEYLDKLKRWTGKGDGYLDLPDMNAALGIVQLAKIDTLLSRRRNIYQMYQQAQMKSETKLFGSASPLFSANGWGFSVVANSRPDDTIEFAVKHGVSCQRTFTRSVGLRYQDRYDLYPVATAFIARALSFPLYPFLSKTDLESVQRVISHLV